MSFDDHPASFRSDERIEAEVNAVRAWGDLNGSLQFNVVELIDGPLRQHLPFSFDINFFDKRRDRVPAFVTFIRGKDHAELNVERKIWTLAQLNYSVARFILCHEIGHLKMHRNDALGFAKIGASRLFNLQPEERAESQANNFADKILVPIDLLNNINDLNSIIKNFNVPRDCAIRRLDCIQAIKRSRAPTTYAGEACSSCANFTLIRIGTYCKCDSCGHRSGPF